MLFVCLYDNLKRNIKFERENKYSIWDKGKGVVP